MYGYIYLTTNLKNGKLYVGQHKGNFNRSYLGTGLAIINAVKKYGRESFKNEIICYCRSKEELDKMEEFFIDKLNAVKNPIFYNQVKGGRGGIIYEDRNKENNPFFGKSQTDYQKQQVSKALKGRKRSTEAIAKQPQNQKGKEISESHKQKLGKKQLILDTLTNEIFEFNSIKEVVENLKIKRHDYDNAKRYKKLIIGRYQIVKEEEKYGRH
jgi:group I intron endonuclease